jgi:hypothetical protein
MKSFRLVFIGAAVVVAVVLAAAAVVLSSAFQTWAVRKALASRPDLQASIGEVSAGLGHVELKNVRLAPGGVVLTIPQLEADLPVLSAALRKKVVVSRLVAKGWTLDFSQPAAPAAGKTVRTETPREFSLLSSALAADAPAAARAAFAGVFAQLRLPVDLSLDGVQLEGEVILPEASGRAKITVTGGRLGAGSEGKFDVNGHAILQDEKVNALDLHSTLTAAMDTPRTFSRVAAKADVAATGRQFPQGVVLTADVAAERGATLENYVAAVVEGGRTLLMAKAEFAPTSGQLDGTWKLDVRDSDVMPFALGHPLPSFNASGEGRFETDATFATVHLSGKLDAAADRLAVWRAELAAVGPLKLVTDFDLAQRGTTLALERLNATIAGAQPVALIQSLQAFTLDLRTRQLAAADPGRELLGITLQGVPLAWAHPFFPGLTIEGDDLRGELVATTRSSGLLVRSKSPLSVARVAVSRPGEPLLRAVDISLNASADYAPQGWQAEVAGLTVKSGDATVLVLDAKAGRLAGNKQPLKATGRMSIDLPALLAQPAAGGALSLAQGEAAIDFVAAIDAKRELQANVVLSKLAADPKVTAEKLPGISASLRADFAPDGRVTLHAPILLERENRKSDLALAGTVTPAKDHLAIEAQLTSTNLVVDDAKVLSLLIAPKPAGTAEAKGGAAADRAPPWAGVTGSLALALKKVVYSDTFEASNVSGTLRLEGGTMRFEKVQGGVGEGGEAKVDGEVRFTPATAEPYAMSATLALKDFDPAPLLRAFNPRQPPTVEGKFTVASKLESRAPGLAALPAKATGDFNVSSTGGVFRGLPVSVSNVTETTSRLASWLSSAGSALGALTGRKDAGDISSDAQAVAEIAKGLNPIAYDQLSVTVTRDDALNAKLKDFTLISPEIRLTGSGQTLHTPGRPVLEDTLAMEFKLRARGHYAELLKYVGALEPQADELGYAACNLPLKIGGTLGQPDAGELSTKVASLALKKTGLTEKAMEKAGEWLAKLRPGK